MFLSAKSHHRQNTLVSVQLINQRESEVEPVRNARAALESKDKQLARHEMMRSEAEVQKKCASLPWRAFCHSVTNSSQARMHIKVLPSAEL